MHGINARSYEKGSVIAALYLVLVSRVRLAKCSTLGFKALSIKGRTGLREWSEGKLVLQVQLFLHDLFMQLELRHAGQRNVFNAYLESFFVSVAEHTNGGPAKRLKTKDRMAQNGNQEHLCRMRKEIEVAQADAKLRTYTRCAHELGPFREFQVLY